LEKIWQTLEKIWQPLAKNGKHWQKIGGNRKIVKNWRFLLGTLLNCEKLEHNIIFIRKTPFYRKLAKTLQ
jgi:hypothetical protein